MQSAYGFGGIACVTFNLIFYIPSLRALHYSQSAYNACFYIWLLIEHKAHQLSMH